MSAKHGLKYVFTVLLLVSAAKWAAAASFTEQFDTVLYKDEANTTANWVTATGRAELQRVSRFAQTIDVISWGGGITAIEYGAQGKWLLGGLSGKINEYDGIRFINHTEDLAGFGSFHIRAIESNASMWLICGDGPRLNSWDGENTWINLSAELKNFGPAANAAGFSSGGNYWLIGGDGGSLNRFDGISSWIDLKTELDFGGNNVKAIGSAGSYMLIAGTNGKIVKYDGIGFTDLTALLNAAWGGYYDIYTMDWNGSTWLLGGGNGKIAEYNGTNFMNRIPGASALVSVWSIRWNGSYWLIGGCKLADQPVLYTAPDASITPYYEQSNPPYFSNVPIWAIGSDKQPAAVNMLGGGNGKLMKRTGGYNSPVNSDLSRDAVDFGANAINFAVSNGSYWMVGGAEGSLNLYDGAVFTDLRPLLGWTVEDVLCAAWNSPGNCWLIGGEGGRLVKYDGVNFYDRTAGLGFAGKSVKTVKWNGSQWLAGGDGLKISRSMDGDSFVAVDISAYFTATESVNAVEWSAGGGVWYIGGSQGSLISYDGNAVISDLTGSLASCFGGSFGINTLKSGGAGKVRIGCNNARLADYESGTFTDISSNLINFGTASIYTMDYDPAAQLWMIGGNLGKINTAADAGIFTDESGNLVNFNQAAVNSVFSGATEWIIAGDTAKLNRWGMSYIPQAWAYSKPVDSWFAGYDCVTLTAAYVLNGQDVDFWISANNGLTWLPAAPGAGVCFSAPDNGTSLLWRASIITYDDMISPYIDTVIVDYVRKTAPTYTNTPTSTRTRTCTASPTATRTVTDTSTATKTKTQTITRTATPTFSGTATHTATATTTGTCTNTPTATGTGTHTPTFTESPTSTYTLTVTETFTITETWTASPTWTETATITTTHTTSPTLTITQTCTQSMTVTLTSTITLTHTITMTPTRVLVVPAVNESIVYPNPARDRLNVAYYMKEAGSVKIRLYNEAGELAAILEENKPMGNGISVIYCGKMAQGVYYCLISLNYSPGISDKFGVKKLIVNR